MRNTILELCLLAMALAGSACSQSSEFDAPTLQTAGRQNAEATSAVSALTLEYLAGGSLAVWCAREQGQEDGTTYAFYSDGTYRFGKQGEVEDGPGIDAFIGGVTVVSREQDRFVVEQAGRQLAFSRGPCE